MHRWPWWGRVVVSGLSMVPTLAPDDRLLVRWGSRAGPGDVVVVRRGDRLDVKRVVRRTPAGWWVEGDNSGASTDSRDYGPVPAEDVVGVVRIRYRPWRHRTRVR